MCVQIIVGEKGGRRDVGPHNGLRLAQVMHTIDSQCPNTSPAMEDQQVVTHYQNATLSPTLFSPVSSLVSFPYSLFPLTPLHFPSLPSLPFSSSLALPSPSPLSPSSSSSLPSLSHLLPHSLLFPTLPLCPPSSSLLHSPSSSLPYSLAESRHDEVFVVDPDEPCSSAPLGAIPLLHRAGRVPWFIYPESMVFTKGG